MEVSVNYFRSTLNERERDNDRIKKNFLPQTSITNLSIESKYKFLH